MIIDCISDLHGHYPKLEGGDLLIIAGDLTTRDADGEHRDFILWLAEVQNHENKYEKIIYIAGNHDNFLFDKHRYGQIKTPPYWNIEYLCDSQTQFRGLKIWGSPWTKKFDGMNPDCMAFTVDSEKELAEKWALIPHDTTILITHSPPWKFLDRTVDDRRVGCPNLLNVVGKIRPQLHVFGHVHEAYGQDEGGGVHFVNASVVNERYKHVNKPIRIEL